jgi:hypothetical protein
VRKSGLDYYLLFNEGAGALEIRLDLSVKGERVLLDPLSGGQSFVASDNSIRLAGHGIQVLAVM